MLLIHIIFWITCKYDIVFILVKHFFRQYFVFPTYISLNLTEAALCIFYHLADCRYTLSHLGIHSGTKLCTYISTPFLGMRPGPLKSEFNDDLLEIGSVINFVTNI